MGEPAGFNAAKEALAVQLRFLRGQAGLTQEDAAGLVGIRWRHLQRVEAAEINVTLRTLQRFANAYGVRVPELLSGLD